MRVLAPVAALLAAGTALPSVVAASESVAFVVSQLPGSGVAGTDGVPPTLAANFDNGLVTRCFGSSHAATALRASWQDQFRQVVADLGTEYVRFHGLLDDDMSVVIRNGLGTGVRRGGSAAGGYGGAVADLAMALRGDADGAVNHSCTFVADQDYTDPGGGVYNASTKEECCDLCYTASTGLPLPCIAAVWTRSGQCYLKLNSAQPIAKPGTGIQACVTDRTPPAAFSCVEEFEESARALLAQGRQGHTFSFVNVFFLFDFLVSVGAKPVVEVSFMPELLAMDASETVFHYKGGISPPKDYAQWRDLITALATALEERYGAEEVRSWRFEVWNEPNCGFFDVGQCCGTDCGNQTAYLDMYVNTHAALKAVDPHLSVGGPSTAQLGWLDWFVAGAAQRGAAPDFVSSHLYPTDPFIPQHRDGFGDAVAAAAATVAAAAAQAGLPAAPPLLITEFNCGLGIACADAPFAASFVAHQLVAGQPRAPAAAGGSGAVPFLSYWTFSDIFEEQGQVASEFSQAFGARSIHGVAKPVYRAMQLLRRLFSSRVPAATAAAAAANTTVDVVVTTNGSAVEALLVNHPGARPDPPSGSSGGRSQRGANDTTVTLHFAGAPPAGGVQVRRVDEDHANALTLYRAAGSPPYPNATFLQALHAASEVPVGSLSPAVANASSWSVRVTMPRYSVAVVSFGA